MTIVSLIIACLYLITPVLLWSFASPHNFISFTSIGQIAGLFGITLFSLTLLLNTRLPILEDILGGLNKVFPAHHLLGKITFISLLLHPVAITAGRLSFTFSDPAINWGIIALAILIVLLFITFFVRIPYNKWITSHRFLGVAFFFAGIHVLSIDSDVSFYSPLRSYMYFVIGAGIAAYCYRTVFSEILVKKYRYFVSKVNLLNKEVVELILTPQKENIIFSPGQFVFIRFNRFLPNEQHPFSITSSPKEEKLSFGIKLLGDFTSRLKDLPLNTPADIEGPYGRFGKTADPQKMQIWIAGGIGITPFVSMARSLDGITKVDLFYSVKNKEEAVFLPELFNLSKKNKNFRIYPWFTDLKTRLDIIPISKQSKNISSKEIFICGPVPMIHSLKNQLLEAGIPIQQIHSEEFQLLPS